MNEIAEQLAVVTSLLAKTIEVTDEVSFAPHLLGVWASRKRVVREVDASPRTLFRDFDVSLYVRGDVSGDGAFDEAWVDLLYDLSAYSEPLSHMGRQLAYQSATRGGSSVTVAITDGIRAKAYARSARENGHNHDGNESNCAGNNDEGRYHHKRVNRPAPMCGLRARRIHDKFGQE